MNKCKLCGCTDECACIGGCAWVDKNHTICSRCAIDKRVIFEDKITGKRAFLLGIKPKEYDVMAKLEYNVYPTSTDTERKKLTISLSAFQEGFGFLEYSEQTRTAVVATLFSEDGAKTPVAPKGKYFTLKELQNLVGGYIELYPARYLDQLILCDEEGLLKKRKLNTAFKKLTGVGLLGNVLLCPTSIFEEPESDDEIRREWE